jgi:hypothetical protein
MRSCDPSAADACLWGESKCLPRPAPVCCFRLEACARGRRLPGSDDVEAGVGISSPECFWGLVDLLHRVRRV